MALIGIDTKEIIEFKSKYDKDTKNPTVFQLGVVDVLTMGRIEDGMTVFTIDPKNPEAKTDTRMSIGKREYELVKAGLKGWTNFKDKKGSDIPFEVTTERASGKSKDVPKDNTLSQLPILVYKEIADVIYNQNKLDEEERKNS